MSRKLLDQEAFYHPETGELLNGIARSLLSNDGRLEYPDPTPMAPPVQLEGPSGMRRLVQQMIREEMSQLAETMEMETFEEADDFDIEDDPLDPLTPYEKVFDPNEVEKTRLAAGGPGPNGSGPTGGGAAAAPPPSSSPTNGQGSPTDPSSNGVRANEPNANASPPGHPGAVGAHRSQ